MPLLLTDKEVNELMTMEDCVAVMEDLMGQTAQGLTWMQARTHMRTPQGFHHVMPGGIFGSKVVGIKIYTARYPAGSRFITVLHDSENGDLLALMQGGRCSQLRTGALSGVATRHMAREDASTVAIIGTGAQGRAQLEGVCAVRDVKSIRAFDIVPERCQAFAAEMQDLLGVEVTASTSAAECVKGADIVTTMTTSPNPVLLGEWLEPGMHINACGGNHWTRRELDEAAVGRADTVVVDSVDEAKRYGGNLVFPIETGVIHWGQVSELWEVASGRVSGRPSADAVTLFEAHGIGISDVAAAAYVYRKAVEQGLGTELPLSA